MDINDSGTVVGYGYDDAGTQTGFIYSEGEYTELMPPGCNQVWVFKINNRGEVLMDGYNCILVSGYTESYRKVFLYSNDTYKELLPPGCEKIEDGEDVGDCFTAYDINDSGTVVGKMMKWTGPAPYDYAYRGVIYSEDNYTALKPMWQDGNLADDIFAINDIGTIVRSKTTLIGEIDWHAAVITRGFIYNGRWYTKLFMPRSGPARRTASSHPEMAKFGAVITALEAPERQARARQLLYWALLNKVPVVDPRALEAEFHEAVAYLAARTGP